MSAFEITGYVFLALTSALMLIIFVLLAKFFLHDRKAFKNKKCEDIILKGSVKLFAFVPKLVTYAFFLLIFLTDIIGEEDNPFVALIVFFVIDLIFALFALYTLNFRVKCNEDTIEYRDLFCIKRIISYDDIYIVLKPFVDLVYYKRWLLFIVWGDCCENEDDLVYYQGQYFARKEGIKVDDIPVKKHNPKYEKMAKKYSKEHPNWNDVVLTAELDGLDVNLCTWYAYSKYEKNFYDGYVVEWLGDLFMKADDADDQDTVDFIVDIDLDPPKGLERIEKMYDQSTIEYEKRKVRFAMLSYAKSTFTQDDAHDYVAVCDVLGYFYNDNLPKEISTVSNDDFSSYKTVLTDWLSAEKRALQTYQSSK